jgi:hypothetical protein
LASCPPLPEEGPLNAEPALMTPEPPRLVTIRMGMKTMVLWKEVTPHYCFLSLILRLKEQKRSGNTRKT